MAKAFIKYVFMNMSELIGQLVQDPEGEGMKGLGKKELELRHVMGMQE